MSYSGREEERERVVRGLYARTPGPRVGELPDRLRRVSNEATAVPAAKRPTTKLAAISCRGGPARAGGGNVADTIPVCVSARESRKLASCPKHVANSAPTPLARDPRTRIRASTPADRGMDAKCRARRACGRKNSPRRAFACGARPLANFARPTESRPRPFLARFPGESEPRASQRFKVL